MYGMAITNSALLPPVAQLPASRPGDKGRSAERRPFPRNAAFRRQLPAPTH